ncbi:hypothetical protein BH09PAT2_BH09PAT2_10110 [soil metagenome]
MWQLRYRHNPEDGQVLLVLVLLIALVITVLTAVSYRITTETQTTKSQEENVRVLAAADSGVEKGVNMINSAASPSTGQFQFSDPSVGLTNLPGIDSQRSRIILTDSVANQFVSSEVPQDEQYTFFLANYPALTSSYTGNIIFYYGSDGTGDCTTRSTPALEVSIIYGPNSDQIKRLLYETCRSGQKIDGSYNSSKIEPTTATLAFGGVNFGYNTITNPLVISAYPNAKIMIVRTLFAKTRVGFASGTAAQLPSQGKLIRSEAVSRAGTSKVVTLTQSFPQIPADFFVTTF